MITPLPIPVPTTADPANFDARADAFLAALPTFADEANALAEQVNDDALEIAEASSDISAAALVAADAAGYVARSTSSLTVGAGTKTVHFAAAKPNFAVNDLVVIILRSDPSIKMFGVVATFDGSDDMTVTVVSSGVIGSGTYSSWLIVSGAFLASGATGPEIWAALTDAVSLTPASILAASTPVAVAYASSITPDFTTGRRFILGALTGTLSLVNPNTASLTAALGQFVAFTLKQDGTGNRTWSVGTAYKFAGGTPALSTAANAEDLVTGFVESVSPPVIRCALQKAFS